VRTLSVDPQEGAMTAPDEMLHAVKPRGPWVVEVFDRTTRERVTTSRTFDDIEDAERFAERAELAPSRYAEIRAAGRAGVDTSA
jgi:hypothetical protein